MSSHKRVSTMVTQKRAKQRQSVIKNNSDFGQIKRSNKDLSVLNDERHLLVQEIVDTEVLFVRKMSFLQEHYIGPLLEQNLFPSLSNHSIFMTFCSRVDQIHVVNSNLVVELQERVDGWNKEHSSVGDIFSHYAPLMKVFGHYSKHYALIARLISKMTNENAKFAEWVQERYESTPPEGKETLSSYLIAPVQRVPRYRLLLSDVIKYTPPSHQGIDELQDGYESILSIALVINETIREEEHRVECATLEKKFTKPITLINAQGSRQILKEGLLGRQTRRGVDQYYFHLMTDLMLYSTVEKTTGKYDLHRKIELSTCEVKEVMAGPGKEETFQVLSPQKSFAVVCKDSNQRDEWLKAVQGAIEALKIASGKDPDEESTVAPMWAQDGHHKTCVLCSSSFGLIKRRHHCRRCGSLVCDTCSKRRLLLPLIDPTNKVRVCDTCVHIVEDMERQDQESKEKALTEVAQMPDIKEEGEEEEDEEKARNAAAWKLAAVDPRYKLLHELYVSERTYFEALVLLMDTYVFPLLSNVKADDKYEKFWFGANKIPVKSSLSIFLNCVEPIATLHEELFGKLSDLLDPVSYENCFNPLAKGNGVGATFARMGGLFKLYGHYALSHFEVTNDLINKEGRLQEKFTEHDHENTCKFGECKFQYDEAAAVKAQNYTLGNLLSEPRDRLKVYTSRLNGILNETPKEHHDYKHLQAALEVMTEVDEEMWLHFQRDSHRIELRNIAKKFASDANIFKPGRYILKDAELKRTTRRGLKTYHFHLFNDLLTYSDVGQSGKFSLHRGFPLNEIKVSDGGDSHDAPSAILVQTKEKSFRICFTGDMHKQTWLTAFEKAFEKQQADGMTGHVEFAAMWESDKKSDRCLVAEENCQGKFTIFVRRHHCRQCGLLCCNACSTSRKIIANIDAKNKVRVCDKCMNKLNTMVNEASPDDLRAFTSAAPTIPPRPSSSLQPPPQQPKRTSMTTPSRPAPAVPNKALSPPPQPKRPSATPTRPVPAVPTSTRPLPPTPTKPDVPQRPPRPLPTPPKTMSAAARPLPSLPANALPNSSLPAKTAAKPKLPPPSLSSTARPLPPTPSLPAAPLPSHWEKK